MNGFFKSEAVLSESTGMCLYTCISVNDARDISSLWREIGALLVLHLQKKCFYDVKINAMTKGLFTPSQRGSESEKDFKN